METLAVVSSVVMFLTDLARVQITNTVAGSTYANYSPGLVGNVQGVVASDSDTVLVQTGFNGMSNAGFCLFGFRVS